MITVEGLSKDYGARLAVDNIKFHAEPNRLHAPDFREGIHRRL
jgi:ABC-type multidrug transport system ATPase subunit